MLILIIFQHKTPKVDTAKCKGSVIFYWRESPEKSQSEERNWGVLKKEIKSNRKKLSIYFDTNNTYAFTRIGECCWEVYPENDYKGVAVELIPKLPSGYGGIPRYPQFKANSLKKFPC